MSILARLQPVVIIAAAFLGILLGRGNALIERHSGGLIVVFLMLMLVFAFLSVDFRAISKSFSNYRFSLASLLINFVWTPLFAFALTRVFMPGSTDLQIGFIMLMVTPCTDWYLVFTGISRGNVALGSSILPINLVLQVVLMPAYILLFMGATVSFDILMIVGSIAMVLLVPLAAACLMRLAMARLKRQAALDRLLSKSDDLQFVLLCLAIIAMFTSQGAVMFENLSVFLSILPPLLLFFPVNLALAFLVGSRLRLPLQDRIPLIFTVSARNSPLSLAIAVVTFPHQPIISLVLVMGPLIELPVLTLYSLVLKNIMRRASASA